MPGMIPWRSRGRQNSRRAAGRRRSAHIGIPIAVNRGRRRRSWIAPVRMRGREIGRQGRHGIVGRGRFVHQPIDRIDVALLAQRFSSALLAGNGCERPLRIDGPAVTLVDHPRRGRCGRAAPLAAPGMPATSSGDATPFDPARRHLGVLTGAGQRVQMVDVQLQFIFQR